jgi:hypothetical protein
LRDDPVACTPDNALHDGSSSRLGRNRTPHLVDPSSFPVVVLLLVIRPAERDGRVDMPNAAAD